MKCHFDCKLKAFFDLSSYFLFQPSWVILSVQCGALLPYPFWGRGEGKDNSGFKTEMVTEWIR